MPRDDYNISTLNCRTNKCRQQKPKQLAIRIILHSTKTGLNWIALFSDGANKMR